MCYVSTGQQCPLPEVIISGLLLWYVALLVSYVPVNLWGALATAQ